MNSEIFFILLIVLTCLGLLLVVFKFNFRKMFEYFSTDDGKGILKGIVLAILFAVVLVFANCALSDEDEWFQYGEMYFGIDSTFGESPQCWGGGPSNKLTSNIGLKLNIFRRIDRRVEANIKYTHHSCALNRDRHGYDAIGIEYTYKFFGD